MEKHQCYRFAVYGAAWYNKGKERLFVQISLKQPYNILTGLCNMEELQLRGLMLQ